MPNVDRFTPITKAVFDLLTAKKVQLGLKDVFYGDQMLIPRTPAATVESGPFTRNLDGVSLKGVTNNTATVIIILYIDKIRDNQTNLKDSELLSEAVMDVLHLDVTLGEVVLHGYVHEITPGSVRKGTSLMRASRVTWQGITRTRI